MTARGAAIALRGVSKRFGTIVALDSVDLEIDAGEVVALCGPSGCGKSTLLRTINFLVEPDAGFVYFDGDPVGRRPGAGGHPRRDSEARINRVRAEIGVVFQQFNLWPHRTVVENVSDPLRLVRRLPIGEAYDRAVAALAAVGLAEFVDRYPASMSGGQQQRVAIARALGMRTRALLFDEPTSCLDPGTVRDVLSAIRDAVRGGSTTVIVTHHLAFAREVADRLIFMDHGRIVESGPPARLLGEPRSPRLRAFLDRVLVVGAVAGGLGETNASASGIMH